MRVILFIHRKKGNEKMVDGLGLERVIIADPKGNTWGFAQKVYNHIQKIEGKRKKGLKFILGELNISQHPDGEFEPRISPNVRQRNVIFIHDSSKEPAKWWVEASIVNDAALRASARNLTYVFPYMRWSRSEKKDKPHISIATKNFLNTISMYPNLPKRIITLDIHAEAIPGFVDMPMDALESQKYVTKYINKTISPDKIVFPDEGAVRRTTEFAEYFGKPLAGVYKRRLSGSKVKAYWVVGDVKGMVCLIPDDIYSSGGTMAEDARSLRKRGAKKVYGYATHFVGQGNYKENLKELDGFFTTDTFYHDYSELPNVKQISLVPLFGEAIYNSESGESVNALFNGKK
jgi:ribose-phosphate pyrophosphokinase